MTADVAVIHDERRRTRAAIERALQQIRDTGLCVDIVADSDSAVVIDAYYEGGDERARILIDPARFSKGARVG